MDNDSQQTAPIRGTEWDNEGKKFSKGSGWISFFMDKMGVIWGDVVLVYKAEFKGV